MTKEELKTALIQNGVKAEDYEKIEDKVDVSKITEIVENATNPEEAFEALHAFNPALEVEQLQKQCEFVAEQVKESSKQNENGTVELTEKELDSVSGGGVVDWWNGLSSTWKGVVIGIAVGTVCALAFAAIGTGIGASLAVKGASYAASLGGVNVGVGMAATGAGSAVLGSGIVGTTMAGFGIGAALGVATGGLAGFITAGVTRE